MFRVNHFLAVLLAFTKADSICHGSIDWASLGCNSSTTNPTPTLGVEIGLFMPCAEHVIDAPPRAVYDALLDFKNYHLWGTFVPEVLVPPNVPRTPEDVYEGMPMTLITTGLFPGIERAPAEEVITNLAECRHGPTPFFLASWKADLPCIPSERVTVISQSEHGGSRLLSFETYYEATGSSLVAIFMAATLQAQFEKQGRELKEYVEKM